MSTYEIKTTDGTIHKITAVTHVRDAMGLTLFADAGRAVAMFPTFDWMRLSDVVVSSSVETPIETNPTVTDPDADEVVSKPVAEGE